MRDQWRADDKYRDGIAHTGKDKGRYRQDSPPASKRQSDTDIGVKIRGQAAADSNIRESRRGQKRSRQEDSWREALKKSPRSPQRRSTGEGPSRRRRELSAERSLDQYSDRHQYRDNSRVSLKRRRSRSRTPRQVAIARREDRRRSRSPLTSDRNDRTPRIRSRHREDVYSRRPSPRGDFYSANYDDLSTSRSIRDSYIPPGRRSRSPPTRDIRPLRTSYRPSQSPSRRPKSRERSTRYRERSSHNSRPTGGREPASSTYERDPRSRGSSKSRPQGVTHRQRESCPSSPIDSRQSDQKRRLSRTPPRSARTRDRRKMQSSTRPIQSILDDSSRPPSPPRPIPSFDSDNHNSNVARDAYPMHGMKANDMHGDSRAGRPHIDTRQPYSTSPQWTPTSSHHGSPQSGSPFSHGRGGWGGPQQFHGQPGYISFMSFASAFIRIPRLTRC